MPNEGQQQGGDGQQQQQQGQQQQQQQQNGQQQSGTPWYASRNDAEFTGTIQTQGLDKKAADEAAHHFYKSWSEANKMISRLTGTPDKDRILIQPKPDATQQEKDAYYERLGRPAKADAYDFKAVKFPDGSELDDNFVAMLRGAAFKANATKEGAEAIARDVVAFLAKADEADAAETASKFAAEKQALEKNWGPNYEANKFVARQGYLKMGFTPEVIDAMEKSAGFRMIMEAGLKAGQAFGEDKYIANRAPNGTGIMTQEQAKARMAELKMETGPNSFGARVAKGDRQAIDEFNAITAMMAGQAA